VLSKRKLSRRSTLDSKLPRFEFSLKYLIKKDGLSNAEAEQRLQRDGPNTIEEKVYFVKKS
jgi:hypothetical protein